MKKIVVGLVMAVTLSAVIIALVWAVCAFCDGLNYPVFYREIETGAKMSMYNHNAKMIGIRIGAIAACLFSALCVALMNRSEAKQ